MAAEQRQVYYSGTVQGVGFRFTACRVAAGYDVTGYVRNLHDTRVECIVEGDRREIDRFLAELAGAMGRYIRQKVENTFPATGKYAGFNVRY